MTHLTLLFLAVAAHAADAAAIAPAPVPLWLKIAGFLGAAGLFWKVIQGSIPTLLGWLRPLALRGVDAFVLLVLSQPVLRWLVIGNKDTFLATANQLLDGLEEISNAVQARLKADLDAAAGGSPPPPLPDAPAPSGPDAPPAS